MLCRSSLFKASSLAWRYCISALSWSCSTYKVAAHVRLLHTECSLACVPIMASPAVPVYFEESWAILSSLGLVNVLFGLMIIGITSLSPVSIVPIVVSVAGAIANGLCYVKNLISLFHSPSSLLSGGCCMRSTLPGSFLSKEIFC